MAKKNYDVVVIGAGPGGYVAAIRASQLGFKTACIDKRESFGGTCLNVGCIPSKALLQSSEHYEWMQHDSKEHGIQAKGLSVDYDQMMERKNNVVKTLTDGISGLFKKNKVDGINASAKFTTPTTLELSNGDTVEAKYFIIATGSESITLSFLPFDEKRVVSSTGALSLSKVPKKLVVIGAGVIGVELASVYNRLGSEVTLVEMLDVICTPMDLSTSKALLQSLKKQGLTFHLSTKVTQANVEKKNITLTLENKNTQNLNADVVLVSVGRRPFSNDLNLEKIDISVSKRGFVSVDNNFRTNHSHIFAIGDLIEGPMLAHRASEEGVAVTEIIAGKHPQVNYMAIPNVVYTNPEVASVGFSEEECHEMGLNIKLGKCIFKANARARCGGTTEGVVKVIGETKTDRLIGLHIVGAHASEIIGAGAVAIDQGATVTQLAETPFAHPTLSEAVKEACLNALGRAIHF